MVQGNEDGGGIAQRIWPPTLRQEDRFVSVLRRHGFSEMKNRMKHEIDLNMNWD